MSIVAKTQSMQLVHCYQSNKRWRVDSVPCCELRNKMRRVDPVKMSELLPFDVITEILSWFPVESLLRFKCVSKQWCLLMQDHWFIEKHMSRASPLRLKCVLTKQHKYITGAIFDENFKLLDFCAGLFLEKSLTSEVCRIRNPATHQVLYLPDAHEGTTRMDFAFNSLTHECKVVCIYREDTQFGLEVLTVGKDEQWRPLKYPNQDLLKQEGKRALKHSYMRASNKAKGVGHFAVVITDGIDLYLEFHSLDIWSECFTITTLPRGLFIDLSKLFVFDWNHRVAVAGIEGEELKILVLEDFKEHKWSKHKIIPLKFLKDQTLPHKANSGEVLMLDSQGTILYQDMKRQIHLPSIQYKPSLIALEGMKSEKAREICISQAADSSIIISWV